MLGLFHALGMETAMIVSPSMSGKYSIPLLRSNPEVFDGFIAVSPVNTASLSAAEYKAIQVREINTHIWSNRGFAWYGGSSGTHLYLHNFTHRLVSFLYGGVLGKTTLGTFDLLHRTIQNFHRVCVLIFLSCCYNLVLQYELNKK